MNKLLGILFALVFLTSVASANMLTNPKLDPFGKIPEFKYCAVAIHCHGTAAVAHGYGTGL